MTTVLYALGINFFVGALVSLLANRFYSYLVRKLLTHDRRGIPLVEIAERRATQIRITVLLVLAAAFCVSNVVLMPEPVHNGRIEGYGEWRYLLYLPGMYCSGWQFFGYIMERFGFKVENTYINMLKCLPCRAVNVGESNIFFSMYPPMNWFGLSLYGIAFGYILIKDKRDSKANARFNMVC